MRLAVDASTLVAEVFRVRGRALLLHESLDLVIAEETWGATQHEVRKRMALLRQAWNLEPAGAERLLHSALSMISARVALISADSYADKMDEALTRISRDPNDAPTVALALALECGIWTHDRDFFGCGIAVWNTESVRSFLPQASED